MVRRQRGQQRRHPHGRVGAQTRQNQDHIGTVFVQRLARAGHLACQRLRNPFHGPRKQPLAVGIEASTGPLQPVRTEDRIINGVSDRRHAVLEFCNRLH